MAHTSRIFANITASLWGPSCYIKPPVGSSEATQACAGCAQPRSPSVSRLRFLRTTHINDGHPGLAMSAARGRTDRPQPAEPLNLNHYATKKSIAESMLDVALLMANAAQLKAVLEQGPEFKYFLTVIILIAASLFFQVLAGALFVNMARKNLNDVANQRQLDIMNNVATGLVFLTVIINIFITAFGVQKTGLYPKQ
ncbi:ninjurin-2 isoform X1 [Pimephales promelas]|uniref:ninjurin-2 isoform X1 n=1 Tax=Pimephales promelas TaxID=90988 RepID=UPI001955735F|nr:ninjurin-2 isoform X1 [Pimephales promelas]KAG1952628.1 ninjurin-2 [Pimephales promelas]